MFKFLLFTLKRFDPLIPIAILIIGLAFCINTNSKPDEKSIFYLQNGNYTLGFKVIDVNGDSCFANKIYTNSKKYLNEIIINKCSFEKGQIIECEGELSSLKIYQSGYEDREIYKNFSCTKVISSKFDSDIFTYGYFVEKQIIQKIENLPKNQSQTIEGVVLGYTNNFEKELKDGFRVTGTSHISALSGFNITLITVFVNICFTFIRNKVLKIILVNIFVLIFIIIVGFSDSILRAYLQSIMLSIYLVLSRGVSITRVICLMLITSVFINSRIMFSLSFILSFLATISLIYFDKHFFSNFDWKGLSLFNIAKQSFITNLFILPISSNIFGKMSILFVLCNILILPAVEILSILGVLTCLLLFIFEPLGNIFLSLSGILAQYIYEVVMFFGSFKLQYKFEWEFTLWGIVGYYFVLLYLIIAPKIRNLYKTYSALNAVKILNN